MLNKLHHIEENNKLKYKYKGIQVSNYAAFVEYLIKKYTNNIIILIKYIFN